MKKLMLCLLVLTLSGCVSSVDGWEVNNSYEKCEQHSGVDYYFATNKYVMCNDGSKFLISSRHMED